jgi:chemotaxis protein MotB
VIGQEIIIIKKKKRAHHAAHGGAWKVAYADFVTALMAFFLVMWLVNASRSVKIAVAGYFREPGIFDQTKSNGPIPGGEMRLGPNQATPDPSPKEILNSEREILEKAAARIKSILAASPELKNLSKQIEIVVTREGLRIELLEGAEPTFFASGSAELAPLTTRVLGLIAGELGKLKNPVIVEGHTDSRPYASSNGYTNWELSADRANAARRVMEHDGLRLHQIKGIRGYADTSLRVAERPLDPRNRRVSVIVQHVWRESDLPEGLKNRTKIGEANISDAPPDAKAPEAKAPQTETGAAKTGEATPR